MKKINNGFAILAILLGITAAFAFKPEAPNANPLNQTLYAVSTDGVHFNWVSTPPVGYACTQNEHGTCEISTPDATPPANTYPASYSVIQGTDKTSAYMPQ